MFFHGLVEEPFTVFSDFDNASFCAFNGFTIHTLRGWTI
jgi:hypothetical protein